MFACRESLVRGSPVKGYKRARHFGKSSSAVALVVDEFFLYGVSVGSR